MVPSGFKVTTESLAISRAAKVDAYPLPRVEELFAALAGGNIFLNLISHKHIYKYNWMSVPES